MIDHITVDTKQSLALDVVRTAHQHCYTESQREQLLALGLPPNPEDVARILGEESYIIDTRCYQCRAENIPVASFGSQRVSICLVCLKAAVALVEKEVTQRLTVNTILMTRDGRFTGNAIVVKVEPHVEIVTDYGNRLSQLTINEIDQMFYIGAKAEPDHKHYVRPPRDARRPA